MEKELLLEKERRKVEGEQLRYVHTSGICVQIFTNY
jgi:hypothetical protein